VEAKILSQNRGEHEGSEPSSSVSPGKWSVVKDPRHFDSSGKPVRVFVRGHLLNHNIHGTGKDPRNLAPITRSYNTTMESRFESDAKSAVDAGNVFYFKTTVDYGSHEDRKGSPPEGTTSAEIALYEAERGLPIRYVMHFHSLTKKDGEWEEGPGPKRDFKEKHELPDQTFFGDNVPILEIDFNADPADAERYLRMAQLVAFIGPEIAELILAARKDKKFKDIADLQVRVVAKNDDAWVPKALGKTVPEIEANKKVQPPLR